MPEVRTTGKRRTGGPVRDPAIQAARSSSDRDKVTDDAELDNDHAPLQPTQGGGSPPSSWEEIEEEAEVKNLSKDDQEGVISAPATARGQKLTQRERKRRLTQEDASEQADNRAGEDRRAFDVSKALQALRSPDQAVRRKASQRLHIRC